MSIVNKDFLGVWDASFKINGDKVVWMARIHPTIIFFNFLLPADHMTGNILPLLKARNLLGGIPFEVADGLYDKYEAAREYLSCRVVVDMEYLILFLVRRWPDLKPFEVV
jgi:hypothetical protein